MIFSLPLVGENKISVNAKVICLYYNRIGHPKCMPLATMTLLCTASRRVTSSEPVEPCFSRLFILLSTSLFLRVTPCLMSHTHGLPIGSFGFTMHFSLDLPYLLTPLVHNTNLLTTNRNLTGFLTNTLMY